MNSREIGFSLQISIHYAWKLSASLRWSAQNRQRHSEKISSSLMNRKTTEQVNALPNFLLSSRKITWNELKKAKNENVCASNAFHGVECSLAHVKFSLVVVDKYWPWEWEKTVWTQPRCQSTESFLVLIREKVGWWEDKHWISNFNSPGNTNLITSKINSSRRLLSITWEIWLSGPNKFTVISTSLPNHKPSLPTQSLVKTKSLLNAVHFHILMILNVKQNVS